MCSSKLLVYQSEEATGGEGISSLDADTSDERDGATGVEGIALVDKSDEEAVSDVTKEATEGDNDDEGNPVESFALMMTKMAGRNDADIREFKKSFVIA